MGSFPHEWLINTSFDTLQLSIHQRNTSDHNKPHNIPLFITKLLASCHNTSAMSEIPSFSHILVSINYLLFRPQILTAAKYSVHPSSFAFQSASTDQSRLPSAHPSLLCVKHSKPIVLLLVPLKWQVYGQGIMRPSPQSRSRRRQ